MPRGTRRTSYVRDTRGRFASTPGGGAPKRPPAKKASRGTNRLTRDNSGRIAGVGKNGATARGGRLRTGAGNIRARQTDRLKRAPLQGVVSRGGKARATAAKKPAGWMQSPEARKDRVQQAADRKGYAKKLRALPKDARRAIQVERLARRQKGIIVAGNTARQLTNIAEGRIRLIGNVGKRKGKLTPGQIGAMARTMSESARRLKVGMATGRRGRMKYNPKALQVATGTAARKIRGARVAGVARKAGAAKAPPPKPAAPKRVKAGRVAGTIAKPRGMKPGALAAKRQKPAGKVDMKQAISRAKELRQQAKKLQAQGEAMMSGGRRDGAIVNMPLSSRARQAETNRGIKGAQLVARAATLNNRAERVLERAVASRKKAEREAAKPARAPRSAESLRLSRAKQVEKRRSINISNPAGWRDDSAGRMAANAARTQQRALAFYGGKPKKKAVASKSPATSKIRPGELMNANAFPSNAIAKSIMRLGGAAMFGNNRRANLAAAARYARRRGYAAQFISKGAKAEVANYTAGGSVGRRKGTIGINVDSPAWDNPNQYMRSANKGGRSYATTTGKGIMAHEMGHRIHTYGDLNQWNDYNNPKVQSKLQIAGKVSTYAAIGGPEEFIAEYRAGRATGRRYTRDIVALYREVVNKPMPSARRRSRLRRTPKP